MSSLENAEKERRWKRFRGTLIRVVDRLEDRKFQLLERVAPKVASGTANLDEIRDFEELTSLRVPEATLDRALSFEDDEIRDFVAWLEGQKKGALRTYMRLDLTDRFQARTIQSWEILNPRSKGLFPSSAEWLERRFGVLPCTEEYYKEIRPERKAVLEQLLKISQI